MDIFHRGSLEPIQKGLNEIASKMIRKFIFLGGVCILLGCSNSIMTGGKAERPLTTERKSARRLLVSEDGQNTSLNQNGSETMVTLVYASRGGVVPVSCELDSLVHVVKTSLCTCVKGTCRVGIRPEANVQGEGSFAFRLSDARQVSSTGSMKVKILPVTISAVSGDKQEGVVGEKLPLPLVALVHNSENVPVSGVKVSWKVIGEDGQVSSCTDVSNDQGKAQCDWTLGTKVDADKVRGDRYVEASIFDSAQDTQKPAPVRFKAVVIPGKPERLAFTLQPGGGPAGKPWSQQPQVVVQDHFGNKVNSSAKVAVIIYTSSGLNPIQVPGGNLVSKAVNGVASFEGLSFNHVGNYSLTAQSSGLFWDVSGMFSITPGSPDRLVFSGAPGDGTAGTILTPFPQITIKDKFGNTVTNSAAEVTLALGVNPSQGILSGTTQGATKVQADKGIATFTGLFINKSGVGYKLKASSQHFVDVESDSFTITHGLATKLVFTSQPGGATAGKPFNPQPMVEIRDDYGNIVTSGADSKAVLTMSLASGTGSLPAETTSVAASSGVAKWANLSIDLVGEKKLRVSKLNLTKSGGAEALTADSNLFSINPGAASKLVFITQPGGAGGAPGVAGVDFAQQPQVAIQDASGNTITDSSAEVTLALGANPGQGILSGTTPGAASVRVVNGIATFTGLFINKSGVGYTLTASGGELTGASAPFNITAGAPAKLAFIVQPQSGASGTPGAAGVAFVQQPKVAIQDTLGNTVTTSTAEVTLALGANPGGGTLSGKTLRATTVQADKGVASFEGLSIDKVGVGYTLTASGERLAGETSSGFDIIAGEAKKLAFIVQPQGGAGGTSAVAGVAFAQQPKVAIQDDFGNTVTTSTTEVTLALGANPGGGTLSGKVKVSAKKGIADFTELLINKSGIGYTLTASGGRLTVATSSEFNIVAGAAAKLAFIVQPQGGTAPETPGVAGVAFTQQPKVAIQDAFENTVTTSTAEVTLALGANPGTGGLGGGTGGVVTVQAKEGIATFSGLFINKSGLKYTLKASCPDVPKEEFSHEFNITHGPATKLVFTSQPGGATARKPFATQPIVEIQDKYGNVVTGGADGRAVLAISFRSGTGSLSGEILVFASSGVAKWTNLSIDLVGEKVLQASKQDSINSGGTEALTADSASFNVNAGAGSKLAFITEPGGGTAGDPWALQPKVAIQDDSGNIVTTSTAEVTLALGANPGGGTLSGTVKVSAREGIATFAGLSINKSGVGYTLKASGDVLTGVMSSGFNIVTGAAAKLAFIVQPRGGAGGTPGAAGEAFVQQPKVAIQDASGNIVTTSTAEVTLALGANPGGGTLSGQVKVSASGGIATFAGLSINKSGVGYTLTASGRWLIEDTSSQFDITAGPAKKLVFIEQPQGRTGGGTGGTTAPGVAGVAFAQQPKVAIQDEFENTVTTSTTEVTLALGANPGGGTLSGKVKVSAKKGIADFTELFINKSGIGYTLTASGGRLTVATSSEFNIVAGAAVKLAFIVQPQGGIAPGTPGVAGVAFTQQPKVAIQDAFENTVTTSTAEVTLALGANPGAGVLERVTTVKASEGIANFSGLFIKKSGLKYTLKASCPDVPREEFSHEFDITHGPATKLVFTSQPGGATAGKPFTTQPIVEIRDDHDNIVTSGAGSPVLTMSFSSGTGSLSGQIQVASDSGVARWDNLRIDLAGIKVLRVNKGALTADSDSFNVNAGAGSKLAFITEPGGGTAGDPWALQPKVAIQDDSGNIVTTSTAEVTLALGANPGGGTLSGTVKVSAREGIATFAGLSINKSGVGYTLTASGDELAGVMSSGFNIATGAAAKLAFIVQPRGGAGGTPGAAGEAFVQQPKVAIQDASGNTVTTSTAEVTLALGANPGGGTLSGQVKVSASGGIATFAGLSINKSGVGYTLTASGRWLIEDTSSQFDITAGPAKKLVFIEQPQGRTGGGTGGTTAPGVAGVAFTQQPKVAIQDEFENTVTTSTAEVTLALGANPGGGTLLEKPLGAKKVKANNGVASFAGLFIDKVGVGYTLTAVSPRLTGAISSGFSIVAGAAVKLAFIVQPQGGTAPGTPGVAGVAFTQQPKVAIQDAFENTVTTSTAEVTLALGANPGAGVLERVTTVKASEGIANFSGLFIKKSGLKYTLKASCPDVPREEFSHEFDITHGPATKLVFTSQPGGATAGKPFTTQPIVEIRDDHDNIVTSGAGSPVLTMSFSSGTGSLSGQIQVASDSGVARWDNLRIDLAGIKVLRVNKGALTADSDSFNVNAGDGSKLVFTTEPGGGTAGEVWARQPKVVVQDDFGNRVTTSTAEVTLTLGANPSQGILSVKPPGATKVRVDQEGVASFAGLSINKSGVGYTLTASSEGLAVVNSAEFNIVAGAAVKLSFIAQPQGGGGAGGTSGPPLVAGEAFAQQVAIQDTLGNTVTTSTAEVTLALGINPGGGILSGTVRVSTDKGVARFTGLSINKSGIGYTLTASSGGLGGTSAPFDVTSGAATKLVFTIQPGGGTAGVPWTQQPAVTIQDSLDNTVTSSSASITVAIGTNPGPGGLSGTATLAASGGVATFSGLSIEKVGIGYTLTASSVTGLKGATSSAFNIVHGPATQLVFTTQPAGAVAGVAFTTQPVVAIRDAYGNDVTGGADGGAYLSLRLATGTGSLSGATTAMAFLGISSWSGSGLFIEDFGLKTLEVNKPDYRNSGGTGPLSATSNSFDNGDNPPPVPRGLGANASDNSVTLSWTASSGALGYNILRGTSANSLIQIATSNTNSYTDATASNDIIYFYAVQASSPRGTSASSANIQAKPLSMPSISSLAVNDTAGAGALVLSWSASAGASNYQVKYSTTSGSASSGIGGCTVTALTCTITRLTPGTLYYFSVNATNTYSGSVNSLESSGIPRSVPTLSLISGHKQITPAFSSAGAISFGLSYGTSAGSYSTTMTGAFSGTAITGLVNGTVYYFKVVAKFPNGSLTSTEVSTAPDGPQPFTITSATPGDTKVNLVWGSSTGATSYTVKYGTSSNSYGSTFATGVTGTSSTVTGLTNGTTYYFMVAAVNGSGSQDASTEFVTTPALPTLSAIADQVRTTKTSNWSVDIPFILGGLSSFTCNGTVAASSSNTGFIANSGLTLSGTYPNCNLNVAGNTEGTTSISLTATHGSATATRSFSFTALLPRVPAAVYSTRLVVVGYNGKAMLVRHGSNNALADVAFDSTGTVSDSSNVTITSVGTSSWSLNQTMAFSTFYRGTSVFVQIWYDQSGNDNKATQLTIGNQPAIVTSGTLETGIVFVPANANFFSIDYKPSLDFHLGSFIATVLSKTGAILRNDVLPAPAIFTQKFEGGNLPIVLLSPSDGVLSFGQFCPPMQWDMVGEGIPVPNNRRMSVFGGYDGAKNISFGLNKQRREKETRQAGASTLIFYIGRRWDFFDFFPMKLNEIILYNTALPPAAQSIILDDQRTYFNIQD